MRYRDILSICAGLALLAGCGQIGGPAHVGQPTEQAQSMEHMLADINQIRAFTYGSGDLPTAQAAADDLVAWSNRMAELFPPGQASVEYVDMSPERAKAAPAAMSGTAIPLQTAVRTGDRGAITLRLAQTERDGCGFCHRSH